METVSTAGRRSVTNARYILFYLESIDRNAEKEKFPDM